MTIAFIWKPTKSELIIIFPIPGGRWRRRRHEVIDSFLFWKIFPICYRLLLISHWVQWGYVKGGDSKVLGLVIQSFFWKCSSFLFLLILVKNFFSLILFSKTIFTRNFEKTNCLKSYCNSIVPPAPPPTNPSVVFWWGPKPMTTDKMRVIFFGGGSRRGSRILTPTTTDEGRYWRTGEGDYNVVNFSPPPRRFFCGRGVYMYTS